MSDQSNEHSISINPNSSANAGNNKTDENGVSLGDSTLQTPEEFEKDKLGDLSADDIRIIASNTNYLQTKSADAAETAERKLYGDTELNKGLEAQAENIEDI